MIAMIPQMILQTILMPEGATLVALPTAISGDPAAASAFAEVLGAVPVKQAVPPQTAASKTAFPPAIPALVLPALVFSASATPEPTIPVLTTSVLTPSVLAIHDLAIPKLALPEQTASGLAASGQAGPAPAPVAWLATAGQVMGTKPPVLGDPALAEVPDAEVTLTVLPAPPEPVVPATTLVTPRPDSTPIPDFFPTDVPWPPDAAAIPSEAMVAPMPELVAPPDRPALPEAPQPQAPEFLIYAAPPSPLPHRVLTADHVATPRVAGIPPRSPKPTPPLALVGLPHSAVADPAASLTPTLPHRTVAVTPAGSGTGAPPLLRTASTPVGTPESSPLPQAAPLVPTLTVSGAEPVRPVAPPPQTMAALNTPLADAILAPPSPPGLTTSAQSAPTVPAIPTKKITPTAPPYLPRAKASATALTPTKAATPAATPYPPAAMALPAATALPADTPRPILPLAANPPPARHTRSDQPTAPHSATPNPKAAPPPDRPPANLTAIPPDSPLSKRSPQKPDTHPVAGQSPAGQTPARHATAGWPLPQPAQPPVTQTGPAQPRLFVAQPHAAAATPQPAPPALTQTNPTPPRVSVLATSQPARRAVEWPDPALQATVARPLPTQVAARPANPASLPAALERPLWYGDWASLASPHQPKNPATPAPVSAVPDAAKPRADDPVLTNPGLTNPGPPAHPTAHGLTPHLPLPQTALAPAQHTTQIAASLGPIALPLTPGATPRPWTTDAQRPNIQPPPAPPPTSITPPRAIADRGDAPPDRPIAPQVRAMAAPVIKPQRSAPLTAPKPRPDGATAAALPVADPAPATPDLIGRQAAPEPRPHPSIPDSNRADPVPLVIPTPPMPEPGPPAKHTPSAASETMLAPLTATATAAPADPPLQAQPLPKDLPGQLATAAKDNRVELLLDPVELGKVRFELSTTGDRVQVILSVERPETLDLLRRNLDALHREFREAGFDAATLSFSSWGKGRDEGQSAPFQPMSNDDGPAHSDADPAPQPYRNTASQGLDLRL